MTIQEKKRLLLAYIDQVEDEQFLDEIQEFMNRSRLEQNEEKEAELKEAMVSRVLASEQSIQEKKGYSVDELRKKYLL